MRRPFGNEPDVSIFTLGTMRAVTSSEQMYEVVKAAFLADINHIETAPAYGPAEELLGKAIKKLKEEGKQPQGGWVLTSKILPGLTLPESKNQLKNILNRLGIKRINNLAIHGINLDEHLDWSLNGEGADFINWAKDKNLVGQVGFSSHGSISLIQKAIESNQFKFCSLHLHLLDLKRIPLSKIALRKGMGVIAISPADKGGRLQDPSQTLIKDCHPIPPLELAYKFLLSEGISTLTVGACNTKDLDLAKKLLKNYSSLNSIEKESLRNLQKQRELRVGENLCSQCEACLPCPNAVPIPELLHLNNLFVGHDLQVFTKERYNLIGKAGHWWASNNASACEKCQECIPRCPNNLEIPKLLEKVHRQLADKPRKRLWG